MDGVGTGEARARSVEDHVRKPEGVREHGRTVQAAGGVAGKEQPGLKRSDAENAGGNDATRASGEGGGSIGCSARDETARGLAAKRAAGLRRDRVVEEKTHCQEEGS